jgi:hypothetical protein
MSQRLKGEWWKAVDSAGSGTILMIAEAQYTVRIETSQKSGGDAQ